MIQALIMTTVQGYVKLPECQRVELGHVLLGFAQSLKGP